MLTGSLVRRSQHVKVIQLHPIQLIIAFMRARIITIGSAGRMAPARSTVLVGLFDPLFRPCDRLGKSCPVDHRAFRLFPPQVPR
jgi:hypothetical protein